ncbi:ribosomal protein L7/L12 [Desertihabitans aurantiacus]|uniref:ribosomal protein L7/L12 n=1 Tax=Desertihabitans aurantiacus TaxID=2282477 RepID=UPI000DF7B38C|nr:ribosomal protein L7/L12 [Desertihabitans aurantiacus]
MFFNSASRREVDALQLRVSQLERMVQELARRAGVDPSGLADQVSPVSARVRGLAGQGRTIEAIRVVREETGLGLAEAKRLVEGL